MKAAAAVSAKAESDYARMARAIDFLAANAASQPGLDAAAAAAGLSPHHFQRVFSRWVGVSPKRFLQVLTVERAKALLAQGAPTLAVADATGLSSGSRLHDHFVSLEAVTPGEYRGDGTGLEIGFGLAESPFGALFAAWTPRGICSLQFVAAGRNDDGPRPAAADAAVDMALGPLVADWPAARLHRDDGRARDLVAQVFGADRPVPVSLHVRGTNFQTAVWRALLEIPPGAVSSYADVAARIGTPRAVRAVGTAVGRNPVAWLIPCHRVIRQTGELGGYRWGLSRKRAMLSYEAVRAD